MRTSVGLQELRDFAAKKAIQAPAEVVWVNGIFT